MKWKRIVSEEYTPEDDAIVMKVIDGDLSEKKYTPTEKFLEVAYLKLNERFFENSLPKNLTFTMEKSPKKHHIGKTNITIYGDEIVDVDGIELNSSTMLTLHEWIESIIHEMIHVQECIEHPEHLFKENYDPHGDWFMKRAKDFTQYGFRITKTFEGDSETSVDSPTVKDAYGKEMLLQIDKTELGVPMIIKILKADLSEILTKLKEMEYEHIVVLQTNSLNSTRLKLTDLRKSNDLIVYALTEKLRSKLKPIEKVETIDLNDIVNENHEERGFFASDSVEINGRDENGIHISIY